MVVASSYLDVNVESSQMPKGLDIRIGSSDLRTTVKIEYTTMNIYKHEDLSGFVGRDK